MRCRNCGKESAEGARFCVNCGQPLSSGQDESGAKTEESKKRQSLIFVIAAILLTSIAALVVIALRGLGTTDAEAEIMESMTEANGGVLPELAYDGEDLVSIDGTFSSVRVLSEADALSAVSEVAPLFGVHRANVELEFQREERDEQTGTVSYVFVVKANGKNAGETGEVSDDDDDDSSQDATVGELSNSEASQKPQEIVVTASKDGKLSRAEKRAVTDVPVDEKAIVEAAYAAYAAKLEEYIKEYGEPKIKEVTVEDYIKVRGEDSYPFSEPLDRVLYLDGAGVCLAELIDFDGDGIEELYLAYYNSAKERAGLEYIGNDGDAYTVEVWTYINGEVCIAYEGKGYASLSDFCLAGCGRAVVKSEGKVNDSRAKSWIHLNEIPDSYIEQGDKQTADYVSVFCSIENGTYAIEHKWEVYDLYSSFTSEESYYADGIETELGEYEWMDSLNAELIEYSFMEVVESEPVTEFVGVAECIELTKETMKKLGLEVLEENTVENNTVIDPSEVFASTLDGIKEEAQQSSSSGGLDYQYTDLDNDGIDELFVSYLSGTLGLTTNRIYKLQNDEAVCIFDNLEHHCRFICCYPQTRTVVCEMHYKGMAYTWYYQYVEGSLVQRSAELDSRNYTGSLSYQSAEGNDVSETEYQAIVSELEKGDVVQLTLESAW